MCIVASSSPERRECPLLFSLCCLCVFLGTYSWTSSVTVCVVASLLAWQHYGVMGAIGCQAACAVCQEQDIEIMKNKQLCMCLCIRRDSHTCTHPLSNALTDYGIDQSNFCWLYQTKLLLGIWASFAAPH